MVTHRSTTRATSRDDHDGPIRTAVEVPDQAYGSRATVVRVDRATHDEDFVVVVHDAEMAVVGASDSVPGGETFWGAVELDDPLEAPQNVTVMLYRATEDGFGDYITVDNVILLDDATVELDGSGRVRKGGR